MIIPELLSPAGNFERLKVAFAYGADAVYLAGKALGMRAKAGNFEIEEMNEGIKYAHSLGKKVYVTVNIIARNEDFIALDDYFTELNKIAPDALIISDLGIFDMARKLLPNMEIHISTQANTTNFASANFWKKLGASRIILARELSLREISEIRKLSPDVELESFVHGAMCMAYSGRCLISNYMNGRDANRGGCSHPCRWDYALVEEKSGALIPVFEDNEGTHIFSSKDLCMIEHIPELINSGIMSFKIEGRMKTVYYVAAVTKTYREAIDDFISDPKLYAARVPYYKEQLSKICHREYTTGFYFSPISEEDHCYTDGSHTKTQDFYAIVENYDPASGFCFVEQRNKFKVGERIEVLKTKGENFSQVIESLFDIDGNPVLSAPHPQQKLKFKAEKPVERFDIIRKKA